MNKDTYNVTWLTDAMKISQPEPNRSYSKLGYLDPFVLQTSGSHCPIFLTAGYNRRELNRWPLITLRDGWLPLTVFFQSFLPESFECRIAIPAEFWYVVPQGWRNRVDLYKIVSDNEYGVGRLPDKILIAGCFSSDVATDLEIERDLENMVERLGGWEALEGIQVEAFMTTSWGVHWWIRGEPNHLASMAIFWKKFREPIGTPIASELLERRSFHGQLYLELNRQRIFSDSYLKHFVLSRGGGLLEPNARALKGFECQRSMRLSFYHSIEFSSWTPLSNTRFEDHVEFMGYYNELVLEGQFPANSLEDLRSFMQTQYR